MPDFPSNPTLNQRFVAEDGSVFTWDSYGWKALFTSGSGSEVFVSDTPPSPNLPPNSLWWQSNTGSLKISFDDGTSIQWVDASAGAAVNDSNYIHVSEFGAVGDGVTDDSVAIQNAINYAKTLVPAGPATVMPAFSSRVTVDMNGGRYAVGNTINMTGAAGVVLQNGMLIGKSGVLAANSYVLRYGNGSTQPDLTRYAGGRDLQIECGWTYNGIDVNRVNQIDLHGITIHAFNEYGLRVRSSATSSHFERIYCAKYFFTDTDRSDYTKRTGIGISSETSDARYTSCESYYCKTPINISGAGSHIFTACHPFNGAAEPPEWFITNATNNGFGNLQLTFASTAGLSNGDIIVVPWLRGISGNVGTSPVGVYEINNVTSTTVDFPGYSFAGTYDNSGTPYIIKYEDEPENVRLAANVSGAVFVSCQFDNGKVVVDSASKALFASCYINKGGTGYNLCGFDLISNGVSGASFGNTSIVSCQFAISVPYRYTVLNGGTLSSPPKLYAIGNMRNDGKLVAGSGTFCASGGTESLPGIIFTDSTETSDDAGLPQIDFNTGIYHPDADTVGISTGGSGRFLVDANGHSKPGDDVSYDLGTEASRWRRMYAQGMVLVDGVTAPSTITGHAVLYVDSSDGDLKIKFSDGTIKTIVTDT